MGYHFYNPHENKVSVARHAESFEKSLKCTRSERESHFAKSEATSRAVGQETEMEERESNQSIIIYCDSALKSEVLPDVRSAYATIYSEESHRVTSSSITGSSQRNQASAFKFNMPNRGFFQRSQFSNTTVTPPKIGRSRICFWER
ncbi:hypothetical protein Tco_1046779 [Tanacetum coccineum]